MKTTMMPKAVDQELWKAAPHSPLQGAEQEGGGGGARGLIGEADFMQAATDKSTLGGEGTDPGGNPAGVVAFKPTAGDNMGLSEHTCGAGCEGKG